MSVTPERSRLAVFSIYTAALIQGLAVVSFPASAGILKAAGRLSDAQYGALFVPQMVATLLGSLFASRLGARAQHGAVLALSLGCAALADLLLAFVPRGYGFELAACATFAVGLGFGLGAAPLNGIPRRLFPQKPDAALVALHTVLGVGFALGPLLASSAIASGVWSALPLGIAATAAALALAALVSLPKPAGAETLRHVTPVAGVGPIAGYGTAFIAVAVLYALAEGTFANWAVVYLREERGVSESVAALALSSFWFALAFGRLAVSLLLARVAAESIWRALPVSMALVFLLLPFVVGPVSAVLGFALAGLSCSAFFPLTVSLSSRHIAGGAARAGSLLTAALMVGVGLGSFVVGPLRQGAALSTLYACSAAYPLAALAICAWLGLRARSLAAQA